MDVWILHWTAFSQAEMEEMMKEDFEEYDSFKVLDLMSKYELKGKKILNVELDYCELIDLTFGQLLIEIEGNTLIAFLDYGDARNQELSVNQVRVKLY